MGVVTFFMQVFYRTTKPVPANRELMVYYGPSYAQDLGIDPNQQLTVYQLFRNPGEYTSVLLKLLMCSVPVLLCSVPVLTCLELYLGIPVLVCR